MVYEARRRRRFAPPCARVFFMLSWLVCFTIFVQAWTIFNEAFASLPAKARGHLNAMMFCFYF